MDSLTQNKQFKLRRVLALRKRDKADSVSIGAASSGNLSTLSANATGIGAASPRASLGPIQLRNQQSFLSSGGSQKSGKKRRREFLDLASNSESELVRFVLDTQGKLGKDSSGPPVAGNGEQGSDGEKTCSQQSFSGALDEPILKRSSCSLHSCSNHASRSIKRVYTDATDQFGLQKRRLVDDFQSMTLTGAAAQTKRRSPSKRQLIQVLDSVDFASESEAKYTKLAISNDQQGQPGRSQSSLSRNSSQQNYCSARNSYKARGSGRPNRRQLLDAEFEAMSDIGSEEHITADKQPRSQSRCSACQASSGSLEEDYDMLLQNQASTSAKGDQIKLEKKCQCTGLTFKNQLQNKRGGGASDAGNSREGYLRLEIADKDIREQVKQQYLGNNRSFFLDRAAAKHHESTAMTDAQSSMDASHGARSRSLNTPTGVSQNFSAGFQSNMSSVGFSDGSRSRDPSPSGLSDCCQNEIELRDRVLSSKRILLRNFFSYYIKSLMLVNEQLNMSYLAKLKQKYMQLREQDKITVREVNDTIEQMQVDEWSKNQLYLMLAEQTTNMRDMLMSDEEAASASAAPATSTSDTASYSGAGASASAGLWYTMGGASMQGRPLSGYDAGQQHFNTKDARLGACSGSPSLAAAEEDEAETLDDIYMDVVE